MMKYLMYTVQKIQVIRPIGNDGPDGSISIANNSNELANVGIGMNGTLAAVSPNVPGNFHKVYTITPTYYVAAYTNLEIGQVIQGVSTIGDPQKLVFPSGKTNANVFLKQDGATIYLDKIQYP